MYRQARLSVQTRDWSERWFGLSTDSKAALVALRDQEPERKRGAEMDLSTQGSRPERD
jgi:hypothetical protein